MVPCGSVPYDSLATAWTCTTELPPISRVALQPLAQPGVRGGSSPARWGDWILRTVTGPEAQACVLAHQAAAVAAIRVRISLIGRAMDRRGRLGGGGGGRARGRGRGCSHADICRRRLLHNPSDADAARMLGGFVSGTGQRHREALEAIGEAVRADSVFSSQGTASPSGGSTACASRTTTWSVYPASSVDRARLRHRWHRVSAAAPSPLATVRVYAPPGPVVAHATLSGLSVPRSGRDARSRFRSRAWGDTSTKSGPGPVDSFPTPRCMRGIVVLSLSLAL